MERSKIKQVLAEMRIPITELCKAIGMNESTFHRKTAKNPPSFKVGEIIKIANYLALTDEDVVDIFFSELKPENRG